MLSDRNIPSISLSKRGKKKRRKLMKICRLPLVNGRDKTIPEFHKVLEAISDFPFAQPFLNRQLLKYLRSPSHFGESTGTNTQYSDFCNFVE